jgi:hypothetical protein
LTQLEGATGAIIAGAIFPALRFPSILVLKSCETAQEIKEKKEEEEEEEEEERERERKIGKRGKRRKRGREIDK